MVATSMATPDGERATTRGSIGPEDGAALATAYGLVRLGAPLTTVAYIRSLWRRRELALALPTANLRAQNRDSALGGLWHLLNPLLLAAVYYLVFGVLLGTDRGVENFVGFLTVGVFTFHYTSKSVMAGAKSIIANEGLIRSVRFPRAVLPVAAVLGEAAALGFAIVVMVAVAVATGALPTPSWALVVPILATQTAFNLGAAFAMARLTDAFRDVEQLLPFALRLWLYCSGVFYAVERFVDHPTVLLIMQFNPAYAFLTLMRDALLYDTTSGTAWMIAVTWALLALIVGFALFSRHEHVYGRA